MLLWLAGHYPREVGRSDIWIKMSVFGTGWNLQWARTERSLCARLPVCRALEENLALSCQPPARSHITPGLCFSMGKIIPWWQRPTGHSAGAGWENKVHGWAWGRGPADIKEGMSEPLLPSLSCSRDEVNPCSSTSPASQSWVRDMQREVLLQLQPAPFPEESCSWVLGRD